MSYIVKSHIDDDVVKDFEEIKKEAEKLLSETEKLCRILDELTGLEPFAEKEVSEKVDLEPRKLFDPELAF